MYLKNSFILILFIILSCQPVEILEPIEIETNRFEKISINAEKIEVNKKGKVRRSRIFYFRELRGKKARIKEK